MSIRTLKRVALFACLAATAAAQVNLLVNGSFESPTVTGPSGYDAYTAGMVVGAGWTASNTNLLAFDVVATPHANIVDAQHGSQVAYFDSFGGSSIMQAVSLTNATNYTLSLYLSGWAGGTGQITMTVAGGADNFSQTFANPSGATWVLESLDFTPTSTGSYTVTLTGTNGISSVFDNVSLTAPAVPEPATVAAWLGGAALCVVGLRRRRLA